MKQHRTDGVSLSFGLFFLAIAGWWAAAQVVDVRLPALGWLAAGALILFGVVGLLGAIRSGHRDTQQAPDTQAPDTRAFGANRPDDTYAGPVVDEPRTGTDLSPEEHSGIVRELLEDPADRLPVESDDTAVEQPDPTAPGQRRV